LPPLTSILMVFAIRLINPLDGPMSEEPGWRGVALPGLQGSGRSPLLATLILAPIVALWHVPLVFAHQLPPGWTSGGVHVHVRGHMGLQPHRRQRVYDPRYARR
jgi:membrane protease YdiL (CAAX protease family)